MQLIHQYFIFKLASNLVGFRHEEVHAGSGQREVEVRLDETQVCAVAVETVHADDEVDAVVVTGVARARNCVREGAVEAGVGRPEVRRRRDLRRKVAESIN